MTSGTLRKLPVWKTAADSNRVTVRNLGAFIKIAWPWIILLLFGSAALYWHFYDTEQALIAAGGVGSPLLFYATAVLSTVIGAFVAVPWHRLLLLGEKPSALLALDRRHWMYAAYAVALAAALWLPLALPLHSIYQATPDFSAIAIGLSAPLFLALLAITTRLSLILPAIALDPEKAQLREIWSITRGNTLRLLVSSVIVFLGLLLAVIVAANISVLFDSMNTAPPIEGTAVNGTAVASDSAAPTPPPSRVRFTIESSLFEFAGIFFGVLFVTFLSLAYRALTGMAEPAPDHSAAKQ